MLGKELNREGNRKANSRETAAIYNTTQYMSTGILYIQYV